MVRFVWRVENTVSASCVCVQRLISLLDGDALSYALCQPWGLTVNRWRDRGSLCVLVSFFLCLFISTEKFKCGHPGVQVVEGCSVCDRLRPSLKPLDLSSGEKGEHAMCLGEQIKHVAIGYRKRTHEFRKAIPPNRKIFQTRRKSTSGFVMPNTISNGHAADLWWQKDEL